MSYKIVPTPPFERELKQLVKKYPAVKDIAALVLELLNTRNWAYRLDIIATKYVWLLPVKAGVNLVAPE
ncbi:hypothetical protein [Paraflavitalea speifideaquila]|uniref:hypothetical protein n=1 Tax=Paraflavitalea speifideaquila TaxID=3076558 RepID=UPI0028F0B9B2|nr:hypothetical protein [Paraflavitalea speifideiaquila]